MEGGQREPNWSETVEDLVDRGDVEGAIAVLESVVADLQNPKSSPAAPGGGSSGRLRLASALGDLGDLGELHASRGCSLRADELRSRALLLREGADRAASAPSPSSRLSPPESEQVKERIPEREDSRASAADLEDDGDGDDWEAIADRPPLDIFGVSSCQPEHEIELKGAPRRRGRGNFLYKKDGLYSDQLDLGGVAVLSDLEEESDRRGAGEAMGSSISRVGTGHVLVLYDFPPSTRTTELEKVFEGFEDKGFAIRWVHDTCALALFQSPSLANQAHNSVHFPFKVRSLVESDDLLSQISLKDLEPPYPRPKTSARTAQRLIAQGMGLKLHSDFGSKELRIQEAARKGRIQARQVMRDDAWGPEDP